MVQGNIFFNKAGGKDTAKQFAYFGAVRMARSCSRLIMDCSI